MANTRDMHHRALVTVRKTLFTCIIADMMYILYSNTCMG